jgi:hypothetical protein
MLMTVQHHHLATWQAESGLFAQGKQGAVLVRRPEPGDIIIATYGNQFAADRLHTIEYPAAHDITGMHGDITLG